MGVAVDGREPAAEIEAAAARWIAARDAAPGDPVLAAAIERWADGDTRRRGALIRAEAIWLTMAGANASTEAPPATRASRRGLLAAGLAAVAVLGGVGTWIGNERAATYATEIGQRRRVALADGSTMILNTASASSVAMTPDRRRIDLSAGEAWFAVAHDRARPFVVSAGDIRVEAVGTAFAVRRTGDDAEVVVTEGRVRVWSEANPARFSTLDAGQRAAVSRATGVAAPERVGAAVADALAWRTGEVVLDGMTLGDAAAEFNRYSTRQLAVEASLADRRIVGRFRAGDIDGFARAAAIVAGGRVEQAEGKIRITR